MERGGMSPQTLRSAMFIILLAGLSGRGYEFEICEKDLLQTITDKINAKYDFIF